MLFVIGATPEGKNELLGFQTGARESTQSWRELPAEHRERLRSSNPIESVFAMVRPSAA